MLPIFHKRAVEQSPYLFPVADVDQQIAARLATLKPPTTPEPDFTKPEPSPVSVVDAPERFAADFWRTRSPTPPPPPKPKPKKRPGRKPVGELPRGADRFTVIDGDGGDKSE